MAHLAVGIDFGQHSSSVAIVKDGRGEVVANEEGYRTTPSIVAYGEEKAVGLAAKSQIGRNVNVVSNVKQFIGRSYNEAAGLKSHGAALIEKDSQPHFEVEFNEEKIHVSPEEVAGLIIGKMKETAESYIHQKVTDVVIAVPVNFNDAQRAAITKAGATAGLNVLRVINEPTAAVLAYNIGQDDNRSESLVLVFDIGADEVEATLIQVGGGLYRIVATEFEANLGGANFDDKLFTHFAAEFKRKNNIDITNNKKASLKLHVACEQTKFALSSSSQAPCSVESLAEGIDFTSTIVRSRFELLCASLFRQTLAPVDRVLAKAGLSKKDVTDIVLVGGGCRMPKIQTLLAAHFEDKANILSSIPAEEVVACGAAVQAALLVNKEDTALVANDVTLDSAAHSISVEGPEGESIIILGKHAPVPTRRTVLVTPAAAEQTAVYVKLLEGESPVAAENKPMAELVVSGVTAEGAELTLEVTVDGRVRVSATAKPSGKPVSVELHRA
eukprot:Colp12_sorted_trinity150504_noHs@19831